ncbi:cupredoxin domain-containing protein [Candidatus Berkiella aquae]|nr:cupredoxin domain-containing protein [Candidatus Berkiella aquae]MCS5712798.1 cupredoxin domain-containing protein [Candidatus Berkiella aquae]
MVNLIGISFIGLIIWWFWFGKSKASTKVDDYIEIKVKDGTYDPAYIQVKANHPITLRFIREDPTPCAEVVVFSTLNISEQLPLNKPKDIVLSIKEAGEYTFTCQMGMYRGKIIVI